MSNTTQQSMDQNVQTLNASLVKSQSEQLSKISEFFENFESYEESVKFLFEVQRCTLTSDRFNAMDESNQENIKVWLPTFMEFLLDIGMLNGKAEMLTSQIKTHDNI